MFGSTGFDGSLGLTILGVSVFSLNPTVAVELAPVFAVGVAGSSAACTVVVKANPSNALVLNKVRSLVDFFSLFLSSFFSIFNN